MNFRLLKRIRVIVSLIFLVLISFLFIDFKNLFPPSVYDGILFFQFVPSILKFINITSIAALGFIVVLILTFLFGRVYCSFLCPLGILQDVIHFFTKRYKKSKIFRPLGDVSPDPNKAIGPGINSFGVFIISTCKWYSKTEILYHHTTLNIKSIQPDLMRI